MNKGGKIYATRSTYLDRLLSKTSISSKLLITDKAEITYLRNVVTNGRRGTLSVLPFWTIF